MHLPSNVGVYNSVPLPAFDFLERRYIRPDHHCTLAAWSKARETERRLDAFEWLAHVAREPRGIESFVCDLSTAYLLSFESALQLLKDERFPKKGEFDKWLRPRPENDILFRGLRTLRQLEAHIRAGAMTQRQVGGHSRFTGSEGGSNIGWRWAPVTVAEFNALDIKRLDSTELVTWNLALEDQLAMELMRGGLERLVRLFDEAEK